MAFKIKLASAAGDVTGWYGYFNKDSSNFCVVYKYEKWNGTAWVDLPEKRAPIVPGRYKVKFTIIPGDNYLLQNTAITDTEFYIDVTGFESTESTQLNTVYNAGDHSTNSDLKLTIKNYATEEIVITYVYYYEGKYYSYAGGEISLDPATYDETKGLIFEKYFHKYTSYGPTAGEKVLDESKKLIKDDIKNAGYYQVYYKLLYPTSANYGEFFDDLAIVTKYSDPITNGLSKTVHIEKANFAAISNHLEGSELNISFYDATNTRQNYNYYPYLATSSEEDSFSSIADPIVSITYGKITIKIEGTERENLIIKVHRAEDSESIPFTESGNVYVSTTNIDVGNYYFVLYHKQDGIENYFESVRVYFKVVQAKIELNAITDNLTPVPSTANYTLAGTSLTFNFENDKPMITMEYNNVDDFEKPEVMYKWISSGALANPTFKITYYNEENCANVKPGNIKDFTHGSFYALINIESEDYSVEAPLIVHVVIEPTSEYSIVVTSNSFVYGNYTDAALAVTANYNALSLYGFAVFFKDDSTITANPDYLALMNLFISDNSALF